MVAAGERPLPQDVALRDMVSQGQGVVHVDAGGGEHRRMPSEHGPMRSQICIAASA
jgi:hypothetical protein